MSKIIEDTVLEVHEAVSDYWEDVKHPSIDETPDSIHDRLLQTQRVRTYLSGKVAELIRVSSAMEIKVKAAKLTLEVAEGAAIDTVKMKDFESAKFQQTRLNLETFEQLAALRKAEDLAYMAKSALEYTREHLKEFDRLTFDTHQRIKLLFIDM